MRFLNRLGPSHHRRKIDELSVIFRPRLGPDRLHSLNTLSHQLEAGFESGAVVFNFFGIPATANAEQEPPAGYLVDRGNQLCSLNGISLHNEAHARTELQGLSHHRRGTQHNERVHDLGVGPWEFAPAWKGCPARRRNVRVLGRPHRLEAARLECPAELHRRD
jgi:hypothetical protein